MNFDALYQSHDQMMALRQRPQDQFQVMHQTWGSLLFLHWEYDPATIQATLPDGLRVHTYRDKAYIGIVPFYMRNIRPRFLPAVPWISNFLEVNVRTYVIDEEGRPGVWFYSLDANQPLAVWLARSTFKLPYHHAIMRTPNSNLSQGIQYKSSRKNSGTTSEFVYSASGRPYVALPGTLEFFLVERYLLFAQLGNGRIASGQVFHQPYPLQQANVPTWDDTLLKLNGFKSPQRPPDHMLASAGVTVDVFPLRTQKESR